MIYMEKAINSLGKFISLMIPIMTISMIVIIVARYFFGIGLTGLQEFVMYMHALVFLGCAGYVHYKDEHVRVDIFYRESSNKYKRKVNFILGVVFLLPVCFVIGYFSIEIIDMAWEIREVSTEAGGLEFRVCVELSRDSQGLSDILKGKDIHRQTASIIGRKSPEEVTKEERQKAKAYTFLPLFGGTGAGEAEHIRAYFSQFYEVYQGIYSWHQRLMDGALRNGIVETPSGRQYYWPSVVRVKKDRVSNATQILNYPVQGFAADIVQLACIRARRKFNELNLKSKLILTVHDSICVDVYPNELDTVKEALTWAMTGVNKEAQRRWNYNMVVPLEIEISGGNNWLDQKEYA